jgi:choice-of-anchor B domain-containing protein
MKTSRFLLFSLFLLASVAPVHAGPLDSPLGIMNEYGAAVAVSGDALFVGEPDNTHTPGLVYVYRRDGNAWAKHSEIRAADGVPGDFFGLSLAADGDRLLVGASRTGGESGRVYVFERNGDTWTQTASMEASDDVFEDGFGVSVALSGDVAYVGAPGQNAGAGAVYVFQRSASGSWAQQAKLAGNGITEGSFFGVSLAAEGNAAAIGAPGLQSGAIYVFEQNTSNQWNETARLSGTGAGPEDLLGYALAWEGNHLLAGAPRAEPAGAVHTFRFDGSAWTEGNRLTPPDANGQINFGVALAIDGNDVLIGAPNAEGSTGALYVFTRAGEDAEWAGATRVAVNAEPRGQLATMIAADDGVALVTAARGDNGTGAALVFEKQGSSWQEQNTLRGEAQGMDAITGNRVNCTNNEAGSFGCSNVDLISFLPIADIGGGRGVRLNDVWGWTDSQTGREYAIVGRNNGTSFVDITDPVNPRYLGDLPMTDGSQAATWRDMKVYNDHVFVVADGAGEHGMQVFDLTQLRSVQGEPVTFSESALYTNINSAHNIVINTETGFAYTVGNSGGGETCGGGLHMINIQDPLNPTFAGCFADTNTGRRGTGYTHDAQCIVYRGPDQDHAGKEICLGSNETALSIADVTDKTNPIALSVASYPNVSYTHQGWITEDHRYFYVDDELDELDGNVPYTRTLIWDVSDLDDPQLVKEYMFGVTSTDHNLYIRGNLMYQANYASGLRIHDISDPENPVEVGYFDTTPGGENTPGFDGAWSNYPFFPSGTIAVSSIGEGLFLVKKSEAGL